MTDDQLGVRIINYYTNNNCVRGHAHLRDDRPKFATLVDIPERQLQNGTSALLPYPPPPPMDHDVELVP